MKFLQRIGISFFMCVSIMAGAQAGVVNSSTVMESQQLTLNKQQIIDFVSTADVQSQLTALGVSKTDAIARINAMTSQELEQFSEHMANSEAGGIVGIIVTVLIVVLVTDLLGITDAYPFINPIGS